MTACSHQLSHQAYCRALPAEAERFATAIEQADLAAQVPTCPDWSVARLAEHLGSVHLWAGEHVRRVAQERIPGNTLDYKVPSDPAGLPAWFRAGADVLVGTLRSCDPDAATWGWGADKHARFWSRRMIHESTIHRADAEFALGREPSIDRDLAIDGVDEFLQNLPHASWAPAVAELRDAGERIALRSPDASWLIRLGPDSFEWSHEGGEAEATIEASSPDLYLLVWGRRRTDDPSVRASGDPDLLKRWVEATRL